MSSAAGSSKTDALKKPAAKKPAAKKPAVKKIAAKKPAAKKPAAKKPVKPAKPLTNESLANGKKPLIKHMKPSYISSDIIWSTLLRRTVGQVIKIDNTFANMEEFPVPDTFIGSLKPHQSTLVRQLLEHEIRHIVHVHTSSFYTDIALIAEPFGSGKTIMSYYIMCSPNPDPRPIITRHTSYGIYARTPQRILDVNLVVMSTTMTLQWEEEGIKFTNLPIFTIKTIKELRELINMINDDSISKYKVILLKNSAVSGPKFAINYDTKGIIIDDPLIAGAKMQLNTHGFRYMSNVIIDRLNNSIKAYMNNIPAIIGAILNMRDIAVQRIFFDDFDTIGINATTSQLPLAFMTYMVSATNVLKSIGTSDYSINPLTIDDKLDFIDEYSINSLSTLSGTINQMKTLTLRNTESYIKSSIEMFKIKYFNYKVKSPDDDLFDILQSMGGNSENYLDMLNADAFNTLGKSLNIKSVSVVDLMNKIIGNKRTELIKVVKSLDVLNSVAKTMEANYVALTSNEIIRYSNSQLDDIKKRMIANVVDFHPNNQTFELLNKITNELQSRKIELSKELERARSNIKRNECAICLIDLEYEDLFLTRCCSIVICSDCAPKSIFREKRTMTGMCPQCRANTSLKTCIYCPGEVDISKILEVDFTPAVIEEEEELLVEDPVKIQILMKLLTGVDVSAERETLTKIKGTNKIINGEHTDESKGVIAKPHSKKKFVIYASYDDPFMLIKNKLKELDMPYLQLDGNVHGRRKTLTNFKNSNVNILLAHTRKDVSGVNLQFADAIIVYHNPSSLDEMEQLMARVQRYGRTCQPEIHRLVNANEVNFK
jgi:hypothetical protein